MTPLSHNSLEGHHILPTLTGKSGNVNVVPEGNSSMLPKIYSLIFVAQKPPTEEFLEQVISNIKKSRHCGLSVFPKIDLV